MSCVCLNQSSKPGTQHMIGVVDVREQLELLGDLARGREGDEAIDHELTLHDAAAEAHQLS